MGFSMVPGVALDFGVRYRGVDGSHTLAGGIEGAHVEDVDALHLSENLETLETGGLLEIGGDVAGLGTGTEQVVLGLDLCTIAVDVSFLASSLEIVCS